MCIIGHTIGQEPMMMRSTNFGIPVTCSDNRNWYRLDPRRYDMTNPENPRYNTQFLYTKEIWKDQYATKDGPYQPHMHIHNPDKIFRMWVKSDPMFTGAYDYESVKYILDSEEGRKYYQFFSRFLMGSEEHYFSSLFFNWNRTKSFVSSLSAQTQWNTWKYGIYLPITDGFKMHTHYLNISEIHFMRGMSKRGVFFARKFSTKLTSDLLNMMDEQMLGIDCTKDAYCKPPTVNLIPSTIAYNITNDAGRFWPGFVPVDMKSPKKEFAKTAKKLGLDAFPLESEYYKSHL